MSILPPLCYSNEVFFCLDNWLVIHPNLPLYFFLFLTFQSWLLPFDFHFYLIISSIFSSLLFSVKMLCVKLCYLKVSHLQEIKLKSSQRICALKSPEMTHAVAPYRFGLYFEWNFSSWFLIIHSAVISLQQRPIPWRWESLICGIETEPADQCGVLIY